METACRLLISPIAVRRRRSRTLKKDNKNDVQIRAHHPGARRQQAAQVQALVASGTALPRVPPSPQTPIESATLTMRLKSLEDRQRVLEALAGNALP